MAVEVPLPRLDPALDVGLRADRRASLHGDVQATHGIDEAAEPLEVDEHVVLDVEAGQGLDGLGRGHEAGVLRAGGELLGMVLTPGVEAVEQALVPAGPPLRHQPGHDGAASEGDVLGLAGEAEQHGPTRLGVDAGQLDAVGSQALTPATAVPAEQEDVEPAVDGSGRVPGTEHRGHRRAGSPHVDAGVGGAPRKDDEQDDEGDEQATPVGSSEPVGATDPPGVDEEPQPQRGHGEQHHLEHREEPPVGDHRERRRAVDDCQEAEEGGTRPHPEPALEGEAPEGRVADRELGRAGQHDREAEQRVGAAAVAARVARGAGVNSDRRFGRGAIEHRGAAL